MNRALIALCGVAAISSVASADIIITEIRSKSVTDPEDFFELHNTGNTAIDISGWSFDDESADFADAAIINGITSIGAGETIVIFQLDENDPMDENYDPAGELAFFRAQWGGLAGVQVGYHGGAGLGKGDAITIFDAMGTEVIYQEYGMTTPNQTHAGDWAAGNTDGSDTYEAQSAIWAPGTDGEFVLAQAGVLGSFQNADGEWGSPGVIPAPGAIVLLGMGGLLGARRRR